MFPYGHELDYFRTRSVDSVHCMRQPLLDLAHNTRSKAYFPGFKKAGRRQSCLFFYSLQIGKIVFRCILAFCEFEQLEYRKGQAYVSTCVYSRYMVSLSVDLADNTSFNALLSGVAEKNAVKPNSFHPLEISKMVSLAGSLHCKLELHGHAIHASDFHFRSRQTP